MCKNCKHEGGAFLLKIGLENKRGIVGKGRGDKTGQKINNYVHFTKVLPLKSEIPVSQGMKLSKTFNSFSTP